MKKFLCTWFGEVCYSSSLTVLPGSVWVVLIYVLQRNFFTSVVKSKIGGLRRIRLPFLDDRYRDRIVLNYSPAVTIREWQQQHRRRGGEDQEGDDDGGDGGDLSAGAPGKSDSVSECPPCLPSGLMRTDLN